MPQPASLAPPPTTSPRIVLRQLSKYFDRFVALNQLEMSIERGEFVVVLGRNGAGKTTLLRTLALLLSPSQGELLYDGCPARTLDSSFRRRLGFVGHETFLYDELTAEENLLFTARLFALPTPARRVAQVLEEMELADRRRSLVRSLSRGLKQRLSLARAWLHEPALLLLDEPATGLDVPTRTRLHEWLAAVALLVAVERSAMAGVAAGLIMSAGLGLYSFSRLAHKTSLTGPLGRLAGLCRQWLMKIGVWHD